jgi:hypothetical protein
MTSLPAGDNKVVENFNNVYVTSHVWDLYADPMYGICMQVKNKYSKCLIPLKHIADVLRRRLGVPDLAPSNPLRTMQAMLLN